MTRFWAFLSWLGSSVLVRVLLEEGGCVQWAWILDHL